jgi:hypothetical protein
MKRYITMQQLPQNPDKKNFKENVEDILEHIQKETKAKSKRFTL